MTKKKPALKTPVSFKETLRDITLYNFIQEQKDTLGVSTYIKMLVEKDMREKGLWKLD